MIGNKPTVKGYIAWNYWDHKILARTPEWSIADAAVKAAITANPHIQSNAFGVEAVEDIHATPNGVQS